MIISNTQLDEKQLQSVETLAALCQDYDGGIPALYYHLLTQKRTSENNVLFLQDEQLIGFLSIYFFYSDACEVSLLVSPSHRRQGIAKQLLKTILPLLRAKEIKSLIFSMPSLKDNTWLTQRGFFYCHSEYQMQRNSYEPILIPAPNLEIHKADLSDIPALCAIDEACFSGQQVDMTTRFQMLLNDNNYTLMLALHEKKPVGKAHIHWQEKGAILSDIAILPQHQGRGWGGEMLAYCINHALTQGKTKLTLDVETSNRNALNLYTRYGFTTINASDFWLIPVDKMAETFQL
ncbi:N-terminal acetyltransferase, GNAT family [Legionella lansingensis]|uniref:N-acetyltransferase domain-containing protein n=1 Tax=Legionella lansingensis TaxID=45067 RepID=A0A0W0VLF6_9GAMM|nr:GNAT family N-acetyltransferase [Legionella lansingensis]KTD20915.1 hypothetical protein Llan_1645 [Legionella lansingensis]SNV44243.1 N-terminal acetyltransferase, GNAT family [Legionella lansingensis]